jgi:hypothetical protein
MGESTFELSKYSKMLAYARNELSILSIVCLFLVSHNIFVPGSSDCLWFDMGKLLTQ